MQKASDIKKGMRAGEKSGRRPEEDINGDGPVRNALAADVDEEAAVEATGALEKPGNF